MLNVGIINFVNAHPLFYALRMGKVSSFVNFVFGDPLYINEQLRNGSCDIALISSAEFLKNQSKYLLLSDLGVASTGPIFSVRLFYKEDPLCLDESTVLVPPSSTTSVRLLRCLSSHFWKVQPEIQLFTSPVESLFEQACPFLLIGDDCLRYVDRTDVQSLDLGEAWNTATENSLIYSLVATRVESFKKNPSAVAQFHEALEQSFQWGENNRTEIIDHIHKTENLPKKTLDLYFNVLEHRLISKHFQGLSYYSQLEG
jgi:chorismate dehydratase